ncbi:MAG: energy-coupling factor ABC transporter permease [Candidatus Gastranaerophilales bacterium]|nr:energy-coupling factor ABC transporter permease [Candidatus Gastranaerophilales bacterium]
MHLGNGIICPVTGIPMLAVAAGTAFYAFKHAKKDFTNDKILPTITLTTLIFALQMINFAIASTGSSGHIVGAILLSLLLGPYVAFLAMCAILVVQAVFFADGGLLALGCNIFNMGFLACFVAYPLLFKPLSERNKPVLGAILSSVAALQLGSVAVVIEGALSGTIALSSILSFTGLMQAIHLPIGIVEGVVTGGVYAISKLVSTKNLSIGFGAMSILLGGFISQYASQKPDGLEWSLLNISDSVVSQTQGILYNISELVQAKTAVLSSMTPVLGNITGILMVSAIMYVLCLTMNSKAVKVDAK